MGEHRTKNNMINYGSGIVRSKRSLADLGGSNGFLDRQNSTSSTGSTVTIRPGEASIFTSQSIFTEMDKFVSAVNNMNETVMIPSRLMDKSLQGGSNDDMILGSDMYSFFSMLNTVKTELTYGAVPSQCPKTGSRQRRLSGCSQQSVSLSEFDSGSDLLTVSDNQSTCGSSVSSDSGLDVMEEPAVKMADTFRHHLAGLVGVLRQFTDVANSITNRYQDEIDERS